MDIQRIEAHTYFLKPKNAIGAVQGSGPRQGAILKVGFRDGKTGYADVHPWIEYGDKDLNLLLFDLRELRSNALTDIAIDLARVDANLRWDRQEAFSSSKRVPNHFLFTDYKSVTDELLISVAEQGFNSIKLKVGIEPKEEIKLLDQISRRFGFFVRLDFNSKGTFTQFEQFITALSYKTLKMIEFVEDPFPYHYRNWVEAARLVPLAADHEFANVEWDMFLKPPFKYIIFKPARARAEPYLKKAIEHKLKIVVTSSLDHPVGQLHALYQANLLRAEYSDLICEAGCLSFNAYEVTPYTALIKRQGPFLLKVEGMGIGFDQLLNQQRWDVVYGG